jgi:hypothetical protein
LQGQLPAGSVFSSVDDAALAVSVLSTWPDGSAALAVAAGVVTAGSAGASKTLRLQVSTAAGAPALSTASVTAAVQSMSVDFGLLGTAQVTNLANPERIWWANAQTICARYRAGVSGHPALEAVFDVQAFAHGVALVEVVVENCKMNTGTPTAPAWASYSAAVFSVNGRTVTTVSSAGAAEGAHSAFRAWYASTWVGGDPGVRAFQDVASLQRHPLFWKMDQAGGDMSGYAADAYVPWGAGRQRGSNMGGTGDDPSIGPIPHWESRFLQTGDPRGARAVETNALAILGFNINYRDTSTGLVPDAAALAGKHQTGWQRNWPRTDNGASAMTWELAHHPAAGLTAFVCRPSPVYIEIAQKIAVWNGTYDCEGSTLTYGWTGGGFTDPTGLFGPSSQIRGRAWGMRSLSHATFLSPDGSAWKRGGQLWLRKNMAYLSEFTTDAKGVLNFFWDSTPGNADVFDAESSIPGFQTKLWQHHFLVAELHRVAGARHFSRPDQAKMDTLADWGATQAVRYVNEQPNGGWRYHRYHTTAGTNSATIASLPTWGAQQDWCMQAISGGGGTPDRPAAVAGTWFGGVGWERTYAAIGPETSAGGNYVSQFWACLISAIERGIPGSKTAWETVQANVTNLSSWRTGFAGDPRWGATPRNI